jgi:acetyl-CoA acyltransferase
MKDAAIVAYGRSAIGKSGKGSLRYVRPDDLAAEVLKGTLEKIPELKWSDIDDIVMGCAFPEAEQGMNLGKVAAAIAGLPDEVCGMTINRFCSSGLQAIAILPTA